MFVKNQFWSSSDIFFNHLLATYSFLITRHVLVTHQRFFALIFLLKFIRFIWEVNVNYSPGQLAFCWNPLRPNTKYNLHMLTQMHTHKCIIFVQRNWYCWLIYNQLTISIDDDQNLPKDTSDQNKKHRHIFSLSISKYILFPINISQKLHIFPPINVRISQKGVISLVHPERKGVCTPIPLINDEEQGRLYEKLWDMFL